MERCEPSRAGRKVYTHTGAGDITATSKYYQPPPVPSRLRHAAPAIETLEAILRSLPVDEAFLMPCSDLWMEAAVGQSEDLRRRFPASIAPRETILTLLDKERLASVLAELGVPHPRSFRLDREECLDAIEDRVFASAMLKPRSSARFLRTFHVKALTVRSRAEAATRLREAQAAGCEMILQEYIAGPPTQHYFIDGFVDRSGTIRAQFARQRLRMHPADFGNSTCMVSIALDSVRPAAESLARLLAHLEYRGIYSAEFKRDLRDGRFYLIEVNVRPWWYVGFAEAYGVPVCEMAYADALGLPLPGLQPYPIGKLCVYPSLDANEYFWHRRNRRGEAHAPLVACVGAWLLAHKAIFAWDDAGPALSRSSSALQRILSRR